MTKSTKSFIFGFATATLAMGSIFYFYIRHNESPPTSSGLSGEILSHPSSKSSSSHMSMGDGSSQRTARPSGGSKDSRDILTKVEKLSQASPELMKRFQLFLLDSDFKPIKEEWDLLGVDQGAAEQLGEELKNTFAEIRKSEVENFKIRSTSPDLVELALPAMSREESEKWRANIEASFSNIFDYSTAKTMSDLFLNNHSRIAAGIVGRDRVVRVRAITREEAGHTSDNYEVMTYILFEGNGLDRIKGDVAQYASGANISRSKDIPSHWKHLFEE